MINTAQQNKADDSHSFRDDLENMRATLSDTEFEFWVVQCGARGWT